MKTSSVPVDLILSKQEYTFCMNVWDITGIGILEEMLLVISSCFWVPILELFVKIAEGGLNFYFSFLFLFYFIFHFWSIFYF